MVGRRKKFLRFEDVFRGESAPENAAAWYVRVSTPGQEDGYSQTFQRQHNRAVADRLGLVVASRHAFEDVATGVDPDRPGFLALQEAVAAGEVRHVLAYDDTRIARDPFMKVQFVRLCKEKGVIIHFADGSKVESMLDEVIQYLKGYVGYDEREKTTSRTMDGKRSAARDNKIPNGFGCGMFGLKKDVGSREWLVDELEAEVVRLVFQWRIEGASFSAIARWLNDRRIKAKHGGEWSTGTVRKMVRNEAYTGSFWWGTHRFVKLNGDPSGRKREVIERPREEWIWMEKALPEIIKPATYRAAQLVGVRGERRGVVWFYHLTEFFWCGDCGTEISGATQTADGKRRKYDYQYYRCQGCQQRERRPQICWSKAIPAKALESAVDAAVRNVVRNPDGVFAEIRASMGGGDSARVRRISSLQKQIRAKEVEVERLSLQMSRNRVLERVFEKMVGPIVAGIERLEDELAGLLAEVREEAEFERFEDDMRAIFSRYSANLDSLDKEGMVGLMRALGLRLTAMPGRVLVTGSVDPSLFTTAQTSASSSTWSYTVVLRPNLDRWPPKRKSDGSRSWKASG